MSNNTFISRISLALAFIFLSLLIFPLSLDAKEKKKEGEKEKEIGIPSKIISGLKWRSIGPAMTSGRIADFAVNPGNHSEWYVAVASGNVWKTVNNGTTFKPVFDKYSSYSTSVITIDPNNPNLLWLGCGENNHQRALGYGDGVYKSEDGGESWKNMGLKESRHIGGIVVDPRNSNVVFVAAEGSAWGPGGERGLYKTIDGGETWSLVLEISENTGVNNVVMDPVDPDVMYATSEQRRRHVFTKIGGGPESAVYRSIDGGETWNKAMEGLPSVHLGGMGIAVSPADRNVVYLIVEAAEDKSGFYRSVNRGASWKKMSDHASSGQYYNEIYCDPLDAAKVYSVETVSQLTKDGGKTWEKLGLDNRHVDDHALWIDPDDTRHFLIGGDGGVYESFDAGLSYQYKSNLPVTQFYRVFADNAYPFYNIFGGTQDNNTLVGPSMNKSREGVTNEDWQAIKGGDGFWIAVDPENPNIVYCESQYGHVNRYDRLSGEGIPIKPRPGNDEDTYKWNWNTPLIISHHSNTRIYMMANKVFRSDDRGNSWEVISDDLTSGTDRNTWPAMGQFWSYDAVKKDVSTSLWGTGVSISESRLNEDLLYVGTDDGVVSITENGGESWKKVSSFPGVPEYTYVSDLMADRFDEGVVYATFDNRKRDDFKPYVMRSTDRGATWVSIASNLPEQGTVHSLEQDTEVAGLLFAGTEFGFYFTIDAGESWTKFTNGMPTISVRDITIQERENDLVIATFGRGFYVLDDYTPLRQLAANKAILEKEAYMFNMPDALMYIQSGGKSGQGSTFYKAKNPEFGATFTYYIKEAPKMLKEERKEIEKVLFEELKPIPQPTRDQLRAEEAEEEAYLVFAIRDASGKPVRKLYKKASKGVSRITWDLRYSSGNAISSESSKKDELSSSSGLLAMPGPYSVELYQVSRKGVEQLTEPVPFNAVLLNRFSLPVQDREALLTFQIEVSELSRVMTGTRQLAREQQGKLSSIRKAIRQTPGSGLEVYEKVVELEAALKDVLFTLEGPRAQASWEELPPMDMPLNKRLNAMVYTHWSSTSELTKTETDQLEILKEEFPPVLAKLEKIVDDITELDSRLEEMKAPWTPGRVPELN